MTVTSVTIDAPYDGFNFIDARPHCNVKWVGGVGNFDVLYEWDTVNTFDSVDLITDTNTGVSASPDEGTPPSDMDGDTTWYLRVTVTDNDDSNDTASSIYTIHLLDPTEKTRFLYVESNIGVGFSSAGGDSGDGDGDPRTFSRYLYVDSNITSDVPVPWIDRISPVAGETGDTVIIYGQGFDNVARDWSAVARLYEDATLDGSYVAMSELDFVAGATEDILTVSIPSGGTTGWVAVVNDDGL